jgi:hypothetical protein
MCLIASGFSFLCHSVTKLPWFKYQCIYNRDEMYRLKLNKDDYIGESHVLETVLNFRCYEPIFPKFAQTLKYVST